MYINGFELIALRDSYACSTPATGSTLDINQWPLLSTVREHYSAPTVQGLPVLNKHLRWPGCNLFIMGGAAALHVGPVARNLFGAKLACDLIVPALIK